MKVIRGTLHMIYDAGLQMLAYSYYSRDDSLSFQRFLAAYQEI